MEKSFTKDEFIEWVWRNSKHEMKMIRSYNDEFYVQYNEKVEQPSKDVCDSCIQLGYVGHLKNEKRCQGCGVKL